MHSTLPAHVRRRLRTLMRPQASSHSSQVCSAAHRREDNQGLLHQAGRMQTMSSQTFLKR